MIALLALALSVAAAPPADCIATRHAALSVEELRTRLVSSAQTNGGECLEVDLGAQPMPYAAGDSALVAWVGDAETVQIAGDMTGWRPEPLERIVIEGSTAALWLATVTLPTAARVDYKLVVDGDWILDPRNPHQQAGGAGLNSELRMPSWTVAPETILRLGARASTLTAPDTLHSAALNAPVVVRVLVPPGVTPSALRLGVAGNSVERVAGDLAVVYVTDGHEYADGALGALPTVVDNLRANGRLEPLLVVLIDPRWDGVNRRQEQLIDNDAFADFVATELVPAVEAAFPVAQSRERRAILGTSLGGLFAATLGSRHPDVFGNLIIQSPAFWVGAGPDAEAPGFTDEPFAGWSGTSVYDRLAQTQAPLRISMSTGTIRDTEDGARWMRDALGGTPHTLTYREVPEGHSWGQWRALVGPQLVDIFGTSK